MKIFKSGCILIFAVFASGAYAQDGVAYQEERFGQCLRVVHQIFSDDESACGACADVLFNGVQKDRSNLLSICHAFNDQPELFKRYAKQLIHVRQKRPGFGKPLHNGTVFKTLPGVGGFGYLANGDHDQWTGATGQFVDVDYDGHVDYLVSFWTSLNFNLPVGIHYYQATYINVGDGWTMNGCNTNFDTAAYNVFQFLFVPCE